MTSPESASCAVQRGHKSAFGAAKELGVLLISSSASTVKMSRFTVVTRFLNKFYLRWPTAVLISRHTRVRSLTPLIPIHFHPVNQDLQ